MDRMPDWAFRIMAFMFNVSDFIKSPDSRLKPFNIREGQTVVDWGCGTGRYLKSASGRVGDIRESCMASTYIPWPWNQQGGLLRNII